MAISYGTVTTGSGNVAGGPYSTSFGGSHDNGSATMLIVTVCANRTTTSAIGFAATYNGVSMTSKLSLPNDSATNTYTDTEVFYITGSWTGSKTLTITIDQDVDTYAWSAIPVSGYDTGSIFGANTWTFTSTTAQSSLTSSFTLDTNGSDIFMVYAGRDPTNHLPTSSSDGTLVTGSEVGSDGNQAGSFVTTYYETVATATTTGTTITGSGTDVIQGGAFEIHIASASSGNPHYYYAQQ